MRGHVSGRSLWDCSSGQQDCLMDVDCLAVWMDGLVSEAVRDPFLDINLHASGCLA